MAPRISVGAAVHPVPASSFGNWTDISANQTASPLARDFASMAYDPTDNEVILFSGRGCTVIDCEDTWAFSGGHWSQLHPSLMPPARRGAGLAWDMTDGYLLLFGGLNDSSDQAYNDTWSFAGGQWTNRTATVPTAQNTPPARFAPGLTFDTAAGTIVLFGGCSYVGCGATKDDTWTYAGGAWTNVTGSSGTPPSARGGEALVEDPAIGSLVLYGGTLTGAVSHTNDTWSYASGQWAQLHPAHDPGIRGDAWTIYDPGSRDLVLFGGLLDYSPGSNRPVGDTWAFNGSDWSNVSGEISASPPSGWAYEDEGTYDGLDGYGLLFTDTGATWSLTTSSRPGPLQGSISATPTTGSVPLGVTFDAGASGGAAPYQFSWDFGDGSPNATGAAIYHTFTVAGVYHPTLTVRDTSGNTTNLTTTITVVGPLTASLNATPSAGVAPLAVQLSATVGAGLPPYSYLWTFGDGSANVTTSTVPSHVYASVGIFTPMVTVTDRLGHVVRTNATVHAVAALAGTLSTSATIGEAPFNVSFTLGTTGGYGALSYTWSFGDGTSSNLAAPSHVYGRPGTFVANVTALDALGETVQRSATISVLPLLSAVISISPQTALIGGPLQISTTVSGGEAPFTYDWSQAPPGCTPPAQGNFTCTPSSSGMFTFTLTLTDSLHVSDTLSAQVTVQSAPSNGSGTSPSLFGPLGNGWGPLLVVVVIVVVAVALLYWNRSRRSPPRAVPTEASPSGPSPEVGSPPPSSDLGTAAAVPLAVSTAPKGGDSPTMLSMADQILVHLYGLGRLAEGETAPVGFTQEGIAQALNRAQNVFAKVLVRLETSGMVVATVHHVQGGVRRRKVYRLTDRGEIAARQARSRSGQG